MDKSVLLERMVFFSDAVFAIALTLLAFEHWRGFRGRIIPPSVFLLSVPAAFVLGSNTPYLWFLLVPAALVSRRLSVRKVS